MSDLGQLWSALTSIPAAQRCFDLAAAGKDETALDQVIRTRRHTRRNKFVGWDVELQLLEAYLQMERCELDAARSALSGIIGTIKSAARYDPDERKVMLRYALSILWIVRGREPNSPLLYIRESLLFRREKVRPTLLNNFPNPDETPKDYRTNASS